MISSPVYYLYRYTMPRPKSFDPDTVLAKAMGVFWEKGYDAASITDLTNAMGINRFSLYDTFGDKHHLYLKALDSYSKSFVEPMVEKINAINSIDDLEAYFSAILNCQSACTPSPCCMMQRAAISMDEMDEETRSRVQCVRSRIHSAFHDALERIKRQGQLDPNLDINDAAWMIMVAKTGLTSFATAPLPPGQARAAIQVLIDRFRA
jgi:TetR/AcrR family transcriptional regulator, transcriptional repressor for nem operon